MKKPKIFVCHSSKDQAFVRWLVARLKEDGIETWFDEVEIKIGEPIYQKINEGLKHSDFFAIVLSKASVVSKWVQEELGSASNMEKYSNRGIFVLPLLLEKCDVPPLLLNRRYANFNEDKEAAYSELADAIYHHFKAKHPDIDVEQIATPDVDSLFADALGRHPDLLEKLSPRQFEDVVALVFRKFGYKTTMTPLTKDGGYDIIVQLDMPEGISPQRFIVECKRYSQRNRVGVDVVRALMGTLFETNADRGIIVTTSHFTKGAIETAKKTRLDLVDRDALVKWLSNFYKKQGDKNNTDATETS